MIRLETKEGAQLERPFLGAPAAHDWQQEHVMDFDQIPNSAARLAARRESSAADPLSPKLNVKATSRWSGLSISTLNKLRLSGDGPPYIKAGRRVLYDIRDVEAWLAKRKRKHTSENVISTPSGKPGAVNCTEVDTQGAVPGTSVAASSNV